MQPRPVKAVAAISPSSASGAAQARANRGGTAAAHSGRPPRTSQPRASAAKGGTATSASQESTVADSPSQATIPMTTTIESAGTSAHQRLRNASSQANRRACGSATSTACTRLRIAIETAKEGELLPLDRRGGLRGDIERHPVHVFDLVDDPVGDSLQQVIRETGPVSGHRVVGGDGADHDRVGVGAAVPLDADREYAEGLPERTVELGGADLFLQDRIGGAEDVESLAVDLAADDADRQAGTGEGLAPDHPLRQAELGADRPHLVLEQHPQRLDQLELEVVGQATDVVVGLDRVGGVAAA